MSTPPLPTITTQVGARVRMRRLTLAMTQRELALACGLGGGQSLIHKMECGERCTLDNLNAVAAAMGIGLKELIP